MSEYKSVLATIASLKEGHAKLADRITAMEATLKAMFQCFVKLAGNEATASVKAIADKYQKDDEEKLQAEEVVVKVWVYYWIYVSVFNFSKESFKTPTEKEVSVSSTVPGGGDGGDGDPSVNDGSRGREKKKKNKRHSKSGLMAQTTITDAIAVCYCSIYRLMYPLDVDLLLVS